MLKSLGVAQTAASTMRAFKIPVKESILIKKGEGPPGGVPSGRKEKAPLSAGLLSHTHFLHGA